MPRNTYAPYGIGHPSNRFWVHAGSYTAPFYTLESAKQFARQYTSETCIRDRDGNKIWKRSREGREWESR